MDIYLQIELLVRILVAGICGSIIGYERKNRLKEAGIRTHFIVALASALIMVISMYGFEEFRGMENISIDPSRLAAQIVSGIGFLGAGIIFIKGQVINGVTTAAGIWATAAVGMTIGTGMYFLGVSATILIILAQILLYSKKKWIRVPKGEQIIIKSCNNKEALSFIQKSFHEHNIEIINIRIEKEDENCVCIEVFTKIPKDYNISNLIKIFSESSLIKSIEIYDFISN